MEKGTGGTKKKSLVATGLEEVNLMDQNSKIGISYQQQGTQEQFARGNLSDTPITRKLHWFKFGNSW